MKTSTKLLLTLLAAGAAHDAGAFIYNDNDLLLVFRKDGFHDVEFNLGTVSNYLGKANGTVLTVANWDLNLVRSNYNNSLANVKFLLVGATSATDASRRIWSTSADLTPQVPPTDLSGSRWGSLRGKISFVGTEATAITATNATQVYAPAANDLSSYSYIVSDGGQLDGANIGGLAPFQVENENPATLLLYELKISNANPKPPAAVIGSFTLDANGALTFTAGSLSTPLPRPLITEILRAGDLSTVSFTTTNGANYQLRYVDAVDGAWTTLPTTVAGDGATKSLTDTTSQPYRFYSVKAQH